MITKHLGVCLALCAATGCTHRITVNTAEAAEAEARRRESQRAVSLGDTSGDPEGEGRCAAGEGRDVREYDTSGDREYNLRKVFKVLGDASTIRMVLVCREVDVNADGRKDVVRYYSDEGRPMREEADRDLDGRMDVVTYFQDGMVVRRELDSTGDGRVDTKVFFDAGKPLRAEVDTAGRSTPESWKPTRWEYYEGNRIVRTGTDLDGDGRVDRWDRDEQFKREQRAAQEAEATNPSDE